MKIICDRFAESPPRTEGRIRWKNNATLLNIFQFGFKDGSLRHRAEPRSRLTLLRIQVIRIKVSLIMVKLG